MDYKEEPFCYVFLNKSLKMSVGKASAQTAHAILQLMYKTESNNIEKWSLHRRTVIVLEARDDAHMRNIKDYLDERGLTASMVIDEGVNEIPPFSITAMAVELVNKNDDRIKEIFQEFKLYKQKTLF